MLKRALRLPRAGFADSHKGARLSSPHFSLTYTKNSIPSGLAVVISKKTAPLSVARHLVKRRMLAVMRPLHHENLACIVYAKKGAEKLTFSVLKAELSELIKRIPLS